MWREGQLIARQRSNRCAGPLITCRNSVEAVVRKQLWGTTGSKASFGRMYPGTTEPTETVALHDTRNDDRELQIRHVSAYGSTRVPQLSTLNSHGQLLLLPVNVRARLEIQARYSFRCRACESAQAVRDRRVSCGRATHVGHVRVISHAPPGSYSQPPDVAAVREWSERTAGYGQRSSDDPSCCGCCDVE